jgi:molecular chaperone GrpE (heat shock protein)
MLKLSLVSKYFILIFLSFFIINASLAEDKEPIQKEEIVLGKTEVEKTKADIESKEEVEEAKPEVPSEEASPAVPSEEAKPEVLTEDISNSNNIIDWIIYVIIFLVMMTVAALIIYTLFDVKFNNGLSFSLTRKKSINLESKSEKPIFNEASKEKVPEIKIPSSDMEGHIAQQSQNINELKKDLANLLKNIDDMNQTFLTLKDNLDRKDEELARFKEGYDATIFKNFILRFTRVDKVLKESISDQNYTQDALEDIQIQMEDALAECDIKIFSPSVGDDFKSLEGVADNPKQIETSKKNQNLTIAEVIQPGYRRKLPGSGKDNFQIITEAKVAIYIYKDN